MSYNKKFATQTKKPLTQKQKQAQFQKNYYQKFGKPYMGKLNSTNQQAIRTGGWANPSKGGELKFSDNQFTNQPPITSDAFFATNRLLNTIANGTDASSRIGRKITIKSLLVRFSVSLQATSTGGSPVRILVVYDKQANAVAPAITDILLTDAFTSQNNLSNRDRFVTIFDNITQPVSVGDCYQVAGNLYKSLNLETVYNAGTDATIGSITSGSIYLFTAQANGVAVAPLNVLFKTRVRYSDV